MHFKEGIVCPIICESACTASGNKAENVTRLRRRWQFNPEFVSSGRFPLITSKSAFVAMFIQVLLAHFCPCFLGNVLIVLAVNIWVRDSSVLVCKHLNCTVCDYKGFIHKRISAKKARTVVMGIFFDSQTLCFLTSASFHIITTPGTLADTKYLFSAIITMKSPFLLNSKHFSEVFIWQRRLYSVRIIVKTPSGC